MRIRKLLFAAALSVVVAGVNFAQTTAFTYQGRLTDSSLPPTAQYDMEFRLFDNAVVGTGTQRGGVVSLPAVQVVGGIFTVQLDFGACATCFDGSSRFIEIALKATSSPTFVTLGPRQPLTSAPYAIKSASASNADNAWQLGGLPAIQYVQTTDTRMTNARNPLAGSNDYVQNRSTPQTGVDFNVTGTGTAGILNAGTHFSIGGQRVLMAGATSLVAGIGASGIGTNNSVFGARSGMANTSGFGNAFFGFEAGKANTSGGLNAFVGFGAGGSNIGGTGNAFFGTSSGFNNTTGGGNAFFGGAAGVNNQSGSYNVMIGDNAGGGNTTGSNNTAIGALANLGSGDLAYATAIGSNAVVSSTDTIVIGKIAGTYNGVARPADTVTTRGPLNAVQTITVKAAPAQSANLQEWQNSSGSVLASISATGDLTLPSRTRHQSVFGTTFVSSSSTASHIANVSWMQGTVPGQSLVFSAPLHLPEGATITEFSSTVYDNADPENINIRLRKVVSGTGFISNFIIASVSSIGANASLPQVLTADTTIAQPIVDNSGGTYYIEALWTVPATVGNIRLVSARVTYTVTSPLP